MLEFFSDTYEVNSSSDVAVGHLVIFIYLYLSSAYICGIYFALFIYQFLNFLRIF